MSNAAGYLAETRMGKGANAAANAIRGNPETVGKVMGVGAGIANGLDYAKIFINTVDSGDIKGGVKEALVMTGKNFVIGLALAPVAAAAPVATAVVGGGLLIWGTVKTCGEIDEKTRAMSEQIHDEGQSVTFEAATGTSLMDMLKKGYKLPEGMSFKDARAKVDWNLAHNRPMYEGVLDKSRKGDPYDPMKPKDSKNNPYSVASSAKASGGASGGGSGPGGSGGGGSGGAASSSASSATSQAAASGGGSALPAKLPSLRPGTASGRAEIVDSEIRNAVSGVLSASDKSSINAGIEARGSGVFGSKLISESSVDVTASGKSNVNTGISANGSTIKDSTITNVVKGGKVEASDGSNANLGVKAGNSVISGSTISNTVTGTSTSAKKGSNVNQGVKFEEDRQ